MHKAIPTVCRCLGVQSYSSAGAQRLRTRSKRHGHIRSGDVLRIALPPQTPASWDRKGCGDDKWDLTDPVLDVGDDGAHRSAPGEVPSSRTGERAERKPR